VVAVVVGVFEGVGAVVCVGFIADVGTEVCVAVGVAVILAEDVAVGVDEGVEHARTMMEMKTHKINQITPDGLKIAFFIFPTPVIKNVFYWKGLIKLTFPSPLGTNHIYCPVGRE
jgi:hypothetical protein